jgi:hypothetical protein
MSVGGSRQKSGGASYFLHHRRLREEAEAALQEFVSTSTICSEPLRTRLSQLAVTGGYAAGQMTSLA